MTAILACSRCYDDIREAGAAVCPECEPRSDPARLAAAEHCRQCGLGWRPLNEHDVCATCAEHG